VIVNNMAILTPKKQKFFDLNDKARGTSIGVTTIILISGRDKLRVPPLAEPINNRSAIQLERAGDPTVTVSSLDQDQDGFYRTVRINGSRGNEVIIATLHQGRLSFNDEEAEI